MKFNIKNIRKSSNVAEKGYEGQADNGSSKSTNLILSIKNTTRMKRKTNTHGNNVVTANPNNINLCLAYDKDDLKDSNQIKSSLKTIGITFANIFRPSKRIGKSTQNIIIDQTGVYLPPVYTSTKSSVQLSLQKMGNFKTPELENNRIKQEKDKRTPISTKSACDLKLIKQCYDSDTNGLRKSQPSMGLKAYTIKSRRNLNELEAKSEEKLHTYKSMIVQERGKRVKFEDEACDQVYDCLQNFHSNEIYYQLGDVQSCPRNEEDVTMEEVNQSSRTPMGLMPFLDTVQNGSGVNPMLSSTTVSMRSESTQSCQSRLSTSPIFPGVKITPFKSTISLASNDSDATASSSSSTSSLSTLLKSDQIMKISKHNEVFSTYV